MGATLAGSLIPNGCGLFLFFSASCCCFTPYFSFQPIFFFVFFNFLLDAALDQLVGAESRLTTKHAAQQPSFKHALFRSGLGTLSRQAAGTSPVVSRAYRGAFPRHGGGSPSVGIIARHRGIHPSERLALRAALRSIARSAMTEALANQLQTPSWSDSSA